MLGPGAGESQWNDPISKFTSRAFAISKTHSPVSINTYLFNTSCVSVLLYKAQLMQLPSNFGYTERAAMHAVFHLATNSLDHASFFALSRAGGPRIRSALVSSRAALFRTAYNTKGIWTEWNRQLHSIASECLPISAWTKGIVSLRCWDTPPFSHNLEQAFKGFPGEPLWAPGAAAALAEIHKTLQQASNNQLSIASKPKIQNIAYEHLLSSRFPD